MEYIDTQKKDHRLAAIMFTDINGFSKMMEINESATLELLDYHNKLVFEVVEKYNGNVIKTIGDAILADFSSVVNAVSASVEIQNTIYEYNIEQANEKQLFIRIGIHLGDIWFFKDDALGEGINIASRLQGLAKPGRICISRDVYNQIYNKLDLEIISLGKAKLKNIEKEIYAFEIMTNFDNDSSGNAILLNQYTNKEKENASKEKIDEDKVESVLIKEIQSEIDEKKAKLNESEQQLNEIQEKTKIEDEVEDNENEMKFSLMDKKFSLQTLLNKVPLKKEIVLKGINKLKEKGFLKQNKETGEYEFELFGGSGDYHNYKKRKHKHFKNRTEQQKQYDEYFKSKKRRKGGIEQEFDNIGVKIEYEIDNISKKKWWPFRKKTPQEYMKKLEKDTRISDFVSHLAVYGGVNGFLYYINNFVSESAFPWWMIVAAGWGIGLLNHVVDFFTKRKLLKRMKKMLNLSKEQFEILKKMHQEELGIKGHITSYIGVSGLLNVIYNIVPGASEAVYWPGIVMAAWGLAGVLPHLVSYFPKMRRLKRDFNEAVGTPIENMNEDIQDEQQKIFDPYQKILHNAQQIRENLREQMKNTIEVDKSWSEEVLPLLDKFIEQMKLLIERDNGIKEIIDDFSQIPLEKEIIELKAKLENTSNPALKREYSKTISIHEKQKQSLDDLQNQREIIYLRLNASLLSLKQLQIDLARMKGIRSLSEIDSISSMKEKSKELSEYLEFLEESHEEVEKML